MKGEVTSIDSEKHFKEFLTNAEDKLVVIDFYADWCGPCKMIGPKFKKLAEEFKDIHFGKVNVDECEDVAESQEISAMPTFIFYKNGNKVDEITGANEAKLRKTIEEKK